MGGKLEKWMCHPKRQLFCLRLGIEGLFGGGSARGMYPFLQIISQEWGREGNLVVRIMLQLSLFRMHTVAFL